MKEDEEKEKEEEKMIHQYFGRSSFFNLTKGVRVAIDAQHH